MTDEPRRMENAQLLDEYELVRANALGAANRPVPAFQSEAAKSAGSAGVPRQTPASSISPWKNPVGTGW